MSDSEMIAAGPETAEYFNHPVIDTGSTDDFTLQSLVNIWIRRRVLIVSSIIFGAVCAVLFIALMKPVYQATSTIELNKASSGSLDLGIGDSAMASSLGLRGADLDTDLHTEAEVLKSDSLAMAVIRKLNLNAHPPFLDPKHPFVRLSSDESENPSERARLVKIFHSELKVDLVAGTELIKVSFRSHDPKLAADVANAVINSYKEMYLQTHYAAVSEASDWMTKQLSDLKANVERSEKQVTDFEKANGILSVPTETTLASGEAMDGGQIHSPVIQKLDDLNAELTAAETDRVQKEAIYRLAESGNPSVILGMIASPIAQGSTILARGEGAQGIQGLESLEARRSELQVQMAQEKAIYGPSNRHLRDLQTQLNTVDAQVQDDMKKIVARAAADLKVAQQTEDAIRARFHDVQVEAGKLNEKNVQLSILSQEAFSRKKLYEDLYTKLQEADVSAGVKASNITVVDPAFPPARPVLPRPVLYLGAGLFFGALFGIGAAYLQESIDTTVATLPEVEQITGSPVVAVIPEFKRSATSRKGIGEKSDQSTEIAAEHSTAWILAHPTSFASEAFRALRTSVFLSRPGGAPKTLLITSSVPAEGKSTVTFNLAIAIAQSGRRVVIIEADMRRPGLKRVINARQDVGLSSVLVNLAGLDEAIVHGVGIPDLDVLPAGPVPPLPLELLSSARFDSVLAELRSRYDIVLIDSPPALILADAIAIATKVDGMIWIVRAGTAIRPHLVRAAQQIRRSHLPLIGFVLNGLDNRIDPYGYGYSYYGYNTSQYGAYYGEDSSSKT